MTIVRFCGLLMVITFSLCYVLGMMTYQLSSLLFLIFGISMAITPGLVAGGQLIASHIEQKDVKSLLHVDDEVNLKKKKSLSSIFCCYYVIFSFDTLSIFCCYCDFEF